MEGKTSVGKFSLSIAARAAGGESPGLSDSRIAQDADDGVDLVAGMDSVFAAVIAVPYDGDCTQYCT